MPEFIDEAGKPVSQHDVDEAIRVVSKQLVVGLLKLPPELAVQLPNILRCLQELRSMK